MDSPKISKFSKNNSLQRYGKTKVLGMTMISKKLWETGSEPKTHEVLTRIILVWNEKKARARHPKKLKTKK